MNQHPQKNRNPGIDLLRALAMLLVILLHFVGQGGLLAHAPAGSGRYWILSFLQILAFCCVNLYGLTTGYVLCDKAFRLSRVTRLWVTTVFWSVAVSCLFFVLVPESRTLSEGVSMFLPILRGRYWFFTAYVVVLLLSPVLNLVNRSLTKGQYRMLLAVLFLLFGIIPVASLGYDVMRISTGHHFSWMIALYLMGGYLRRFADCEAPHPTCWLLGYFGFALVHLMYRVAVTAVGLDSFANLLITYPSPLIVGESLCLFLYFRNLGKKIPAGSFGERCIRFLSPGVYSVYVIHVHPLVFWNAEIIALFRAWDSLSLPALLAAMLGAAAAVFVLCVCLDTLRQGLFRLLGIDRAVEKLSDCMERTVRNYLR